MNADLMPIPNRLRPDLEWSPYQSDRSDLWIAHDPIHREFYFFSAVEKAIALCLDGRTSVQRVVKYARRIDDSVCETFVRNLIVRLDRTSLLLNGKWRQPGVQQPNAARWLARASSWMAWRVPLLNPTKAIDMLGPIVTFAFGRTVLSVGVGALLICFFLLANRWSEFVADFSALQSAMRGDRLLLAGLLLLAIKAMHEIGHALACRSVGAECREMGLFLFLFVPCMYCDVSDTWRVPSRWKRMLVSAAGMITEMAITLIAFAIWYTSDVPWVRGIAAQVMLLCSVVTVLVNANPLLRYDGYYILSDAIGIPNLADQARESWSQLWRSWVFGMHTIRPISRGLPLAIYHVASSIYRLFLLSVLIWGVNQWLLEMRLGGFGAILSSVVGTAIVSNAWLSLRASRAQNDSYQPIRWFRLTFWVVSISLLGWMVGTWKFPKHLFARGVLEPGSQVAMYARHSGLASNISVDGSPVRAGDAILMVQSPELELQWIQAVGDLSVAMVRLRQAASRSVDDPLAAQQINELEQTELALRKRVEKISDEVSQQQIRSEVAGVFVDSLSEQTKSDISGRRIGQSVRLGQIANDGPFVERGQAVGDIVSPESWRLRTFVNELEINECKVGASTFVRLDQFPGLTLRGRVVTISEDRLERTPGKLLGDTLFASTLADVRGTSKPEQTTYSLAIEFDVQDCKPIANGLASVQIQVGEDTMFNRWIAMLQRSWNIEP